MRAAILCALWVKSDALEYDETRAIEYAKLAGAAYCKTKNLEQWNCGYKCSPDVTSVTVCQGDSTKAFVGSWEGKGLVSFEGSSNIPSFIEDIQIDKSSTGWEQCNNCKVHDGFLKEWNSLRVCVMQKLESKGFVRNSGDNSTIRTTGHSLGAALNNLAMIDLSHEGWYIEESYDFGKPRTGDQNFAKIHDTLLGDRTWRVTHDRDPIPQLPPSTLIVDWHFQHVEPEIYYPGKVSKGYEECFEDKDSCIEQHWNLVLDAINIPDHLDYMGVDTSIFGCPIFEDEEVAV